MATPNVRGDRAPAVRPDSHLDTAQFFPTGPTTGRRAGRAPEQKPSPRENAAVARKRAYARALHAGVLDQLSTAGAFGVAYGHARPILGEVVPLRLARLTPKAQRFLRALHALGREQPPLLTHENVAESLGFSVASARRMLAELGRVVTNAAGEVVTPALVTAVPYFDPNTRQGLDEHASDADQRRQAVRLKMPHSERGAVYQLAPDVELQLDSLDGSPVDNRVSNPVVQKMSNHPVRASGLEHGRSDSSHPPTRPSSRSGGETTQSLMAAHAPEAAAPLSTAESDGGRPLGAVGPARRQDETCQVFGGAGEGEGGEQLTLDAALAALRARADALDAASDPDEVAAFVAEEGDGGQAS